jgi:Ser/Thr protein kinase RdoA (MazF antagonist)
MQWPPDHPIAHDVKLAEAWNAASLLCDEQGFTATMALPLRYMPGRRLTSLVSAQSGQRAILKLFHSPRARGNARRIELLSATDASAFIPALLALESSGRAGLFTFLEGTLLDEISDEKFIDALRITGTQLRALHQCGAELDRSWTFEDEAAQLVRRAPASLAALVESELDHARLLGCNSEQLVPSHRDFHPRQIVVQTKSNTVRFIDFDDAAMAPAGLDVGNMIAHLRREHVMGARTPEVVASAIDALLHGYGPSTEALVTRQMWERIALVRLACLAETRHADVPQQEQIVALLAQGNAPSKHADRPVRVGRSAGRRVVIKRYHNGNGPTVYAEMRDLWVSPFGAGRLHAMPEPLAFDPATGDLTMEMLHGPALGQRGSIGQAITRGSEAAELLVELHRSGVRVKRVRGGRALVRSTMRKATDTLSCGLGRSIDEVGKLLAARWAEVTEDVERLVVSHGDFSPRNILATEKGLRLIDFDRLQLSHPARDLSYWCAWLWATQLQCGEQASWDVAEPFLQTYSDLSGHDVSAWHTEMGLHRSVALVRIAHGWSALRSDEVTARVIIEEARRQVLAVM